MLLLTCSGQWWVRRPAGCRSLLCEERPGRGWGTREHRGPATPWTGTGGPPASHWSRSAAGQGTARSLFFSRSESLWCASHDVTNRNIADLTRQKRKKIRHKVENSEKSVTCWLTTSQAGRLAAEDEKINVFLTWISSLDHWRWTKASSYWRTPKKSPNKL